MRIYTYNYDLVVIDGRVIKNRHGFNDQTFQVISGYTDILFTDPEDNTIYLQTSPKSIDWSVLNNEPSLTDKLRVLLSNWI